MASAQTISVGPSASYKTIQSAINAASAGDTIIVNAGTYYENIAVDKTVTLKAAPGATVIVDAGKKYPAFMVHASKVWIEGFTVRNGGPSYSGFYLSGSGATIVNNKVSGCGWGIFLTSGTGSTIRGNTVDGGTTAGICLRSSSQNTVLNNVVTNSGKGLSIEGTSNGNKIYLNDFNNGYSVSGVTNSFQSPAALTYTYHGKVYTCNLGNHWAGLQAPDANGNGVGDKAYYGTNVKDVYVLMESQANYVIGGSVSPTPTPNPTITPTGKPTVTPTPNPTITPTGRPTVTPTPNPGGAIYINPAVPANAVRVASQTEVNALAAGANAVLTADLSSLTISKQINLFAAGHKVGSVTMTAAGARLSGAVASLVTVKAANCVVDHCTIYATGANAVRIDRVNGVRVLSNTIHGSKTTNCVGIYATNMTGLVADGNTLSGAYYNIYTYGCKDPQISFNIVKHETGFRQGNDYFITYTYGGVFRNNEVEYDPYHGPGHMEDHNGMAFDHVFGMTLENNKASGHYYCFKVYNSEDVLIQNNVMYKGGACLRVGFYCERITVKNNKITGDAAVGYSDVWINDGVKDSVFEGNEISYMQYGIKETHYPPGTKYLYGHPSLPCSNITLKNNFIHHCTVALCITDKGSCIEIGNRIENCKQVRNYY